MRDCILCALWFPAQVLCSLTPEVWLAKHLDPRSWSWNFVERGPGFLAGVESSTISGDPVCLVLQWVQHSMFECQFDLYLATCGTQRMVNHTKQAKAERRIQKRTYFSFVVREGSISIKQVFFVSDDTWSFYC